MLSTLRRLAPVAIAGFMVGSVGFHPLSASAASAPPTAVTGPPSSVALSAATIAGDVNPDGLATSWHFEYGTTPSFGLSTAPGAIAALNSTVGVASRVEGLTPGTRYYYRLVAGSSAGTAYGHAGTFVTAERAPTVVRTSVSSVGDSTAVVAASIDAHGLASTWYVRFVTASGVTAASTVRPVGSAMTPVATSALLARLVAHTTYDVQVVATNAAGSSAGPEISFTTTGAPLVTAQSATALTSTSVILEGALIPDGHATSWYFQYGTTSSYDAHTPVKPAGAGGVPVAVADDVAKLDPNTTYHFRLVARSADGTAVGTDSTFTTLGPSLSASAGEIVFGRPATLSGTVPDPVANQVVAIYAQAANSPSYVQLATVLSDSSGAWAFGVTPEVGTTYKALWKGEASPTVSIAVSPSVILRVRPTNRFLTHVSAASSMVGRLVRLQRLDSGVWRTVATRRLNRDSAAAFGAHLPSGTSQLRVYLSAYQAGFGYVAGNSAVHTYRLK